MSETPPEIKPDDPPVTDPAEVVDEVPDPPDPPGDDVPKWGQELQTSVTELSEKFNTILGNPVGDAPPTPDVIPPDDSPVREPWTHRKFSFFGKG